MLKMFETSTDSDGPFYEDQLCNKFVGVISDNEVENLARWCWHSKPGDTTMVGLIKITCITRKDER